MSRISYTNAKKVAPAPQPYCAHCFNLGKDESVFRSHFIRESPDPSSKIVCPELLATECPYCFKQGHTKSRCPIILAQDKTAKKEESRQKFLEEEKEKAKKATKTQKVKVGSKFAALMEDSDSEDEKPVMKVIKNIKIVQKIEEFPALTSSKKVVPSAPRVNSYAAMTSKSKSEYEDEQFLKSKLVVATIPPMPQLSRGKNVEIQEKVGFWAEYDSAEEEETEYIERKMSQRKIATTLSLSQWSATVDSDDEDW